MLGRPRLPDCAPANGSIGTGSGNSMRYLLMATAVALSIGAFAGQASAQASGPPAKVCKNLLGKVIPCPVAKPTGPAKPGVMSHLAGLGHPAGPAAPPPHPGPAMAMLRGLRRRRSILRRRLMPRWAARRRPRPSAPRPSVRTAPIGTASRTAAPARITKVSQTTFSVSFPRCRGLPPPAPWATRLAVTRPL